MGNRRAIAVCLVLLVATGCRCSQEPSWSIGAGLVSQAQSAAITARAPDAFYDPPANVPGQPGVLLRSEPLKHVTLPAGMRRALRAYPHAGVCLQAYLRRTADDLASLVPLGGGIRLVKGAYREAASVAYPRKHDVDENYFTLATQMLAAARRSGLRCVFGTHDQHLIARLQRYADNAGVPREAFEFHMLYGIQRSEQIRLARDGYRVKVLISYGEQWFPWYMLAVPSRWNLR